MSEEPRQVLEALEAGELTMALGGVMDLAEGEERVGVDLTSQLGSTVALNSLVRALETRQPDQSRDDLIESGVGYLSLLDNSAVAKVCRLYPQVENDDVRRVLRRFLSARVGEAADAIAELMEHEDPAIVREGMGILAMGGKRSRAWELMVAVALDASRPERAGRALQAIGRVSGEKDLHRYFEVIDQADDPKKSVAAVRKLQKIKAPVVFDRLVQVVQREGFGERTAEEIQTILGALAELDRERSIPIIEALANTRALLFGRKAAKKLRNLAGAWLKSLKKE